MRRPVGSAEESPHGLLQPAAGAPGRTPRRMRRGAGPHGAPRGRCGGARPDAASNAPGGGYGVTGCASTMRTSATSGVFGGSEPNAVPRA